MRKIWLLMLPIICLLALIGCDNGATYEGVAAVFYLEGGTCQNSKERVTYLYQFEEGEEAILIYDPNVVISDENDRILRTGYHIEGWYQTKTLNADDTYTYADPWDFTNDKMSKEGVTLYAKWERNVTYTYSLYYKNASGEAILLQSYQTSAGNRFNITQINKDNRNVKGYTTIGYLDEDGNPWDDRFTHPGGDTDKDVKVFLDLIEGDYEVVRTLSDLKKCIANNDNIYLANDINCEDQDSLEREEFSFEKYTGEFLGNNHKISNFNIAYNAAKNALRPEIGNADATKNDHLYVSLFYNLENAIIKDVVFENVEINIDISTRLTTISKIVVTPLATIANNTTLSNVDFSGKVIITRMPECEFEKMLDSYWYKNENSTVDTESTLAVEFIDERN